MASSCVVISRKADPHDRCGYDAHQNGPGALFLGQSGGGKTDDDGIVTRQHKVDPDDLHQRNKTS
jgi:hypothetical protein